MIYKASDLFYALTNNYLLIVEGNTMDDIKEVVVKYPEEPEVELWKGAEILQESYEYRLQLS